MSEFTETDIETVTRTLWGEARGEGFEGMVAVAWVIRNRVELDLGDDGRRDWWGEGYTGVCKAPMQFSCWNPNDRNFPYMVGRNVIPSGEWAVARQAALAVMDGQQADPTGGATHYHATRIQPPNWVRSMELTATVGRHVFYKALTGRGSKCA